MKAHEYRDGDIVEVSPGRRDGSVIPPFLGVVDSHRTPRRNSSSISRLGWVYVRQLSPRPGNWPGGWYAQQCRLISRPPQEPALPVPDNIELSNN